MKRTIRLNERELHAMISESVKRVLNENGWTQDPMDWTVVNTSEDGREMYKIGLWWGSGYVLDIYLAWGQSEQDALDKTVAYIEQHHPEILEKTTEWAQNYLEELMSEHGIDSEEADQLPEFQETFYYVDATMDGASQPYYIFMENLTVLEVPNEWKQKFIAREQQGKLDESINKVMKRTIRKHLR